MSRQTTISNFYKSVNPNRNKTVDVNKKFSRNLISSENKKSLKTNRSMTKPNSIATTPSKVAENFTDQTNSDDDLIVMVDLFEESNSSTDLLKTERLSLSLNIPTTPVKSPNKKGKSNLKRTLSQSKLVGNSPAKKKPQSNGSRAVTKHLKHRSPKKLFQDETIDAGRVSEMIDNLNVTRAGIFPRNQINLEKFYSTSQQKDDDVVNYDMNHILTPYDVNGVVLPKEKHAEHLFFIIQHVFYNLINCGYFNDRELDTVFAILTLSENAQSLLARMLKRKHCWRKASSVEYPEIGSNLKPYFEELERHNLLTSDMEGESLETLLRLLSVEDLKKICKQSGIPRPTNKELALKHLLKTCSIKPLFPGVEGPAVKLRKSVLNTLNYCINLREETVNLVDRIVTLFIPSEDVSSQLSDIFLKLTLIKDGTLKFPEVVVQHDPVFENREHLIGYVESRNKWRRVMEMRKENQENWEIFTTIGREADRRLRFLLDQNPMRHRDVAIPRHVKKFREEYVCIKIITNCLEVFKKKTETIPEAIEMLHYLISQECYLQGRKGEWYEELALIEMRHMKNLEAAASLTIRGLTLKNLGEISRHVLIKRASTIAKRRTVNKETKSLLKNLIDAEILRNTPSVSISASVVQGNQKGRKSTWSMDIGGGDRGFMTVEHRAKFYYESNGYPDAWHCEGSLPVTLFTLLMWEELYDVFIPAAYLSNYQKAPLDLFTSEFYENRKESLDKKMEHMKAMSGVKLGESIERSYEIRQHYECLMPTALPPNIGGEELRIIVECMGSDVVTGICKRLALNFSGSKAGFPDLLVWNPFTMKCKFVEVKGPGDTLSAKQTLWLRYLEDLGAATELCEVKAGAKNE